MNTLIQLIKPWATYGETLTGVVYKEYWSQRMPHCKESYMFIDVSGKPTYVCRHYC